MLTKKIDDDDFLEFINQDIKKYTSDLHELRLVSDMCKSFMNNIKKDHGTEHLSTFDDITIRHGLHTLIVIATLDLLSNLKLYRNSTLDWEKRFLIKTSYLTMHETIVTFEKRKHKLRELLIAKNIDTAQLDEINKDLRKFKKTFDHAKINSIRNKVAGHIDEDFEFYFDTLTNLNLQEGLDAIYQLLEILTKLNNALFELRLKVNQYFEQEAIRLRQIIAKQFMEIKEKLANDK